MIHILSDYRPSIDFFLMIIQTNSECIAFATFVCAEYQICVPICDRKLYQDCMVPTCLISAGRNIPPPYFPIIESAPKSLQRKKEFYNLKLL